MAHPLLQPSDPLEDDIFAEWIGVDLDGTLAMSLDDYSDPTLIGNPVPSMVEKVLDALDAGYTVKVFTARMADKGTAASVAAAIARWTEEHIGTALEATNAKTPGTLRIWDDKARQVEEDRGTAFYRVARPTQAKIDLLVNQMKLTPDQVEACIEADPTPNQTDFVQWLAKQVKAKALRLPEDRDRIRTQLENFIKLKRSPNFCGSKDINAYTPATLATITGGKEQGSPVQISNKEKERQTIAEGSEIVVEKGSLLIRRVDTAEALVLLSGGTHWCTAHKTTAEEYLRSGPSFVIFEDGSAYGQLHPESDQYMDRNDVSFHDAIARKKGKGLYFIFDSVALEAVRELAEVDGDVARWFRRYNTPIDTVRQELATSEQGTVESLQLAIIDRKPLPPEIEEKLTGIPLSFLTKYGVLFHKGTPWAPLEKALLRSDTPAMEFMVYARKFMSNDWPEGDRKLLKHLEDDDWKHLILEWAKSVHTDGWPALKASIPKISSSRLRARLAHDYATKVSKKRWPEMESIIAEQLLPRFAADYATQFGLKEYPAYKDTLITKHLVGIGDIRSYLTALGLERDPDIEKALIDDGNVRLGVEYAAVVIKGRWEALEPELAALVRERLLAGHSSDGYLDPYLEICRERIPALEKVLLEVYPHRIAQDGAVSEVDKERRNSLTLDELGRLWDVVNHYCVTVREFGKPWIEGEHLIHSRNPVQEKLFAAKFTQDESGKYYRSTVLRSILNYMENLVRTGETWPEGMDIVRDGAQVLEQRYKSDNGLRKQLNQLQQKLSENRSKKTSSAPHARVLIHDLGELAVEEKNTMYFAYLNGKNVATASLSDDKSYLVSITVEPEYRRKGIARALYGVIEQDLGYPLHPSPKYQSEAAKQLWRSRDTQASPESGSHTAAPLHTEGRARVYFHGTDSDAAAKAIQSAGIQPREISLPDKAKSRSQLAPARGRVYLTDQLGYAAIYALGGNMFGSSFPSGLKDRNGNPAPYGYLFEVRGEDLAGDVVPDEDSIGKVLTDIYSYDRARKRLEDVLKMGEPAARFKEPTEARLKREGAKPINQPEASAVRYHLQRLADQVMTDRQRSKVIEGMIDGQAAVGKKVQKLLSPSDSRWLLDHGAHMAHLGAVFPVRAWRFRKVDAKKIQAKDVLSICEELPVSSSQRTAALSAGDRTFYHGTNADPEFDDLRPTGGDPVLWLGEQDTAGSYAAHMYRKGRPRLFEVKLKPNVKIIDMRDLKDPVVQEYMQSLQDQGYDVDETVWDYYAGYSHMHQRDFHPDGLRMFLLSRGYDGAIVNDRSGSPARQQHDSLALLNMDAIASQREVPSTGESEGKQGSYSGFAQRFNPQELATLAAIDMRAGEDYRTWLETLIGDDEAPSLQEVLADEDMRLDYLADWLQEEHLLGIHASGALEFETLTTEVEHLIGTLPVVVYHHTSSKILAKIKAEGLRSDVKRINKHENSGAGVYVTTERAGPAVNGYHNHAVRGHRGGSPVTLVIRTWLEDLSPDPDDVDIGSGERQFYLPYVAPANLLEVDHG